MFSTMSSEYFRTIKSYVKRGGRLTKAQENALLNLSSDYVLSIEQGQLNYSQTFHREAATVLEIGFGNGQTLLQMASEQPMLNFIGIEVHPPGVGMLLQGISQFQLTNLKTYQADAVDVLKNCIPKNSLRKIQIFFPDPWPKKRHHKRRLIQTEFLDLLHTRVEEGGILHLATDWEDYANHIMSLLEQNTKWKPFTLNHSSPEDLQNIRGRTKFETRGMKLGHKIHDLLYQSK